MKVRISYVVEVNDTARRAIRHYYGERGLADISEVKRWFIDYGRSNDYVLAGDEMREERKEGE